MAAEAQEAGWDFFLTSPATLSPQYPGTWLYMETKFKGGNRSK